MTLRRLLIGLLAACFVASPCAAAIGTPSSLGHTQNTASASLIQLTGVTASAGQLIVVVIRTSSAVTSITSCTDSASNSYTATAAISVSTGGKLFLCYARNPSSALTAGSITANFNAASANANMAAAQVSGTDLSSPLDKTSTGVAGTSTANTPVSPAATSGTLSQADEIAFGATAVGGTAGTYTASVSDAFTNLSQDQLASGNPFLALDYRTVAATTSISDAPSWVNSRTYTVGIWTFKAAATSTSHNNLLLLGVGE